MLVAFFYNFESMNVLLQNITQFVAFSTEMSLIGPPYIFNLKKRETEQIESFESNAIPNSNDYRITVFEWTIVDREGNEDISKNEIFLSIGQWDYVITDGNNQQLSSGFLRVEGARDMPVEHQTSENFIVYG